MIRLRGERVSPRSRAQWAMDWTFENGKVVVDYESYIESAAVDRAFA
ncbi:MAG TPA: hypothetical protein VKT30_13940 [Caulobacteraceae bacterium]|nr:hypothetical protein [Caulobacteraceae bacterium]